MVFANRECTFRRVFNTGTPRNIVITHHMNLIGGITGKLNLLKIDSI
jgi:hypothetical protein